jgi:hypothetical protein
LAKPELQEYDAGTWYPTGDDIKTRNETEVCVIQFLWIWRKYLILTFSIGVGSWKKRQRILLMELEL